MANKRLIDANALWTDVMMLPHNGDMISSEEVEQTIKDAPTVDAVEVVHAHWTTLYTVDTWMGTSKIDCFVCSECGKSSKDKGNYCPNCGAKMGSDGSAAGGRRREENET